MLQFNEICSVTLVLFSVIDILGSLPVVIEIRNRAGGIQAIKATLGAGVLMILFLYLGERVLHLFGTDVSSFAIAGAFVIFAIGIEMILGVRLFRDDPSGADLSAAAFVPLAFPLIAGAGTLTTILSLKSEYASVNILSGITANLCIIFFVLRFCGWFEKRLGDTGLAVMRKVFGVILLSIAIKLVRANLLN